MSSPEKPKLNAIVLVVVSLGVKLMLDAEGLRDDDAHVERNFEWLIDKQMGRAGVNVWSRR